MRSSLTPFSDESSPSSSPLPASSAPKYPATSRIALFGTPPEPSPLALRHSDENTMSKSNVERRYKASKREVCLKIASMDGITEDIGMQKTTVHRTLSSFHLLGVYAPLSSDTPKLQVYLCAPRTVEHDRWLPRVTLRTKLDNIMREGLGQNTLPRGKRFNNNNVEKKGPRIELPLQQPIARLSPLVHPSCGPRM
jgi:hypothetical protein